MNRIYSYCSYKQSPAGFQLGCTDIISRERIHLSKLGINEFVRRSFESGKIKEVYGKLPHSDRYIYIVKKLKYMSENEDEFASIVHMNFAFEFESYEEYSYFTSGARRMKSDELATLLYKSILPEVMEDDFALLINGEILSQAIEKIKLRGNMRGEENYNTTHFILKSKQTGVEEIKKVYKSIIDTNTALYKISDYEIILKKNVKMIWKQKGLMKNTVLVMIMVVLLMLLIKILRN